MINYIWLFCVLLGPFFAPWWRRGNFCPICLFPLAVVVLMLILAATFARRRRRWLWRPGPRRWWRW